MRTLLTRSSGLLGLLFLAVATAAPQARAQRIGLEAGIAGVEHYEPVSLSAGLSLFLPLTERLRFVATGSQWVGCDDSAGPCGGERSGFGNRGVNLLGLFQVAGSRDGGLSVGGGVGWYEMYRLRDGESHRHFDDAITLSAEARRAVAYNSAVYLRGDLSFPTDDSQPRWSFLRAGVDVGGMF